MDRAQSCYARFPYDYTLFSLNSMNMNYKNSNKHGHASCNLLMSPFIHSDIYDVVLFSWLDKQSTV